MSTLVKRSLLVAGFLALVAAVVLFAGREPVATGEILLDDCSDPARWRLVGGDRLAAEPGREGSCLAFDFALGQGKDWVVVSRDFPETTLPARFAFSFHLKGEGPKNNLEFKVFDARGNVYWRKFNNFDFPREWRKITVFADELEFAWGPGPKDGIRSFSKIEIGVSKGEGGGKGRVWLDDLALRALPAGSARLAAVAAEASSAEDKCPARNVLDGDRATRWSSDFSDPQWLVIDLGKEQVFDRVTLYWEAAYARNFQVQASRDKRQWRTLAAVTDGDGGIDNISFSPVAARYLRVYGFLRGTDWGYSLFDCAIHGSADRPQDLASFPLFDEAMVLDILKSNPLSWYPLKARLSPRGEYPRWFYDEFCYWTVVGSPRGFSESLVSEDGLISNHRQNLALMPFLYRNGRLLSYTDVTVTDSLVDDYLPIPIVTWNAADGLELQQRVYPVDLPGAAANYVWYRLKNNGSQPAAGRFFVTVRPFEATPPWMFGGFVRIHSLAKEGNLVIVNDTQGIVALSVPDGFGAVAIESGTVMDYLRQGKLPAAGKATSALGFCDAALSYRYDLQPGEEKILRFVIPMDQEIRRCQAPGSDEAFDAACRASREQWAELLNRVKIDLATPDLFNAYRSNLAYILIQKDGAAIQPGSRNYDRSWMRDGAEMAVSLLRTGHGQDVRAYIDWVTGFQYDNGRIPPILYAAGYEKPRDRTLNEYDGQGCYIHLIAEYYRFFHDRAFLEGKFPHVVKALKYLEALRRTRLTDEFKNGPVEKKKLFGILPESISHEGYAEPGNHSYWDDYWAIRGWEDAMFMAEVLGEKDLLPWMKKEADDFKKCLAASIKLNMSTARVDFIPGCGEKADFDATSTAIAVWPTMAVRYLDAQDVLATLDKYYREILLPRADGSKVEGYTPYELRTANSYLLLGQPDKSWKILNRIFQDRRPLAWNHWGEVVYPDYRTPRYVGDAPHSWEGGIFINLVNNIFVYHLDDQLVLGAGLTADLLAAGRPIGVERFPTPYGEIDYSVRADGSSCTVKCWGDAKPPRGFVFKSPYPERKIKSVTVAGKPWAQRTAAEVRFPNLPVEMVIRY